MPVLRIAFKPKPVLLLSLVQYFRLNSRPFFSQEWIDGSSLAGESSKTNLYRVHIRVRESSTTRERESNTTRKRESNTTRERESKRGGEWTGSGKGKHHVFDRDGFL